MSMKISIFFSDTLQTQHYRAGRGIMSSSNPSRLPQEKQHNTSALPDRSPSSQLIGDLQQTQMYFFPSFTKASLMPTLNILPDVQLHYFYTCPIYPRRTEYIIFIFVSSLLHVWRLQCSLPSTAAITVSVLGHDFQAPPLLFSTGFSLISVFFASSRLSRFLCQQVPSREVAVGVAILQYGKCSAQLHLKYGLPVSKRWNSTRRLWNKG